MENYLRENWTEHFRNDFAGLPQAIRDLAGDLFEIKWYGGGGLEWELEHNILGTKEKAAAFMQELMQLTTHQKNLVYFAYEA